MQRYSEYKDSGVQWLGEIPSHWEVKQLKNVATYNDEVLLETEKKDRKIKYIEIGDVDNVSGVKKYTDYEFKDAPSRARRITHKGDVIVSTVRTYLKAITSIEEDGFIVSTGFTVLRANKVKKTFLKYYLLSDSFINEVISLSVGTSYPAINSRELVAIKMPVPSACEQECISVYLDSVTSKIDTAIAQQQKMIDLLNERKQIIINNAVTKGLDPNVKMKDSGVEWIGEIPEHWEVKPLKYCAKTNSGSTPRTISGKENPLSNIKWVRTTDLSNSSVYDTSEYLSLKEMQSASCPLLSKNTVLISMYGGSGSFGKLGILKVEATINQALCSINCFQDVLPLYIFYYLQAVHPVWMKFAASTRKDPNLNQDIIRNMSIVLPTIQEQKELVEFISHENKRIQTLIQSVDQQISLLQERKQIIINDVVTGKVKVV